MLEIKGIVFEVEITRKQIKNLYIHLKDNRVLVSAPLLMPEYRIYRFLEEKRDWIYCSYIRMQKRENNSLIYKGGDLFYLFDKEYKLIRTIGQKKVYIEQDNLHLSYPNDGEDGIRYLYKYLDKYLLAEAERYLQQYRTFLQDYGYILKPEIGCRIMRTRWGVCYTRKNKINISSYLIHYPLYCLEYIMVHEMTHFIVANHSRRFYEIVSRNMPDYKKAVNRLKQ